MRINRVQKVPKCSWIGYGAKPCGDDAILILSHTIAVSPFNIDIPLCYHDAVDLRDGLTHVIKEFQKQSEQLKADYV